MLAACRNPSRTLVNGKPQQQLPASLAPLNEPAVSHIPWYEVDCDIFVPCAKSGVIDEASAEVMRCAAVRAPLIFSAAPPTMRPREQDAELFSHPLNFSPTLCSRQPLQRVDSVRPGPQVCGSANVPFSSERALRTAMCRGIHFVPEAISSAGAVLADSIEFYDPDLFYGTRNPQPVCASFSLLSRSALLKDL